MTTADTATRPDLSRRSSGSLMSDLSDSDACLGKRSPLGTSNQEAGGLGRERQPLVPTSKTAHSGVVVASSAVPAGHNRKRGSQKQAQQPCGTPEEAAPRGAQGAVTIPAAIEVRAVRRVGRPRGSMAERAAKEKAAAEAAAGREETKEERSRRLLLEKNRRGQANARRRKREGLEARESEVTALAARVANLELEAAQLAVQNAALEQDASSIDMTAMTTDSGATGPASSTEATTASSGEPSATSAQTTPAIDWVQLQVGYADMLSIMRHRLVTVDEVQQMGATQNQDVAREMMQSLKDALAQGQDARDLGTPIGARLAKLVQYQHTFRDVRINRNMHNAMTPGKKHEWVFKTTNPDIINPEATEDLVDAQQDALGPPPTEHWNRVLAAMELDEGQMRTVLDARKVLLARMAVLVHDRARIVVHLREADAISLTEGVIGDSQQVTDALAELVDNLGEERHAVLAYMAAFDTTVQPWQNASALVAHWPWLSYTIGVVTHLAKLRGEEGGAVAGDSALLPHDSPFRMLTGSGAVTTSYFQSMDSTA
mmetsp:Transcript_17201/g.51450  ORF Transcript_17201/g.51450 Transcript_17201/m.51450 type:complete len:544 (-) Transcript_17201:816-2447(-)